MYYNEGFVGIGTNNPSSVLHVEGNNSLLVASYNQSSIIEPNWWETNYTVKIVNKPSTSGIGDIYSYNRIGFFGNDNGGSPPSQNLIPMGIIGVQKKSDSIPGFSWVDADMVIALTNDGGNGPSEKMRIQGSNGYVGIGTTSPSTKLDINGTTRTQNLLVKDAQSNNVFTVGTAFEPVAVFAYNTSDASLQNHSAALSLANYDLTNYSTAYLSFDTRNGADEFVSGAQIVAQFTGHPVGGGYPTTDLVFTTASNIHAIERLRIKSNGNVGIGTNNPISKTVIYGEGERLSFQSSVTGVTETDGFFIDGTFADNTAGAVQFWNFENQFMRFGTNNLERIRITNSGNVGIGTTSPSAKLDIWNGSLVLHGDATTESVSIYTSTSNFVIFQDPAGFNWIEYDNPSRALTLGGLASQSADRLWIVSNGNIGIGTSSPSAKLDIWNGSLVLHGDATTESVSIYTSTSNFVVFQDPAGFNWIEYHNPSRALTLGGLDSQSADRLWIVSNGNVGIGTSNPSAKFQVNTTNPTNGDVAYFLNTTANGNGSRILMDLNNVGSISIGMPNNTRAISFGVGSGFTTTEYMRITSSGNVGIGTTNINNTLVVGTAVDAGANVPSGIIKLQGSGANDNLTHADVGNVNGPAMYHKSSIGGALSSDSAWSFEVARSTTPAVAMYLTEGGITNVRGWVGLNNKSNASYQSYTDNRSALIFGASNSTNAWFVGARDDDILENTRLGIYSWWWNSFYTSLDQRFGSLTIGGTGNYSSGDANPHQEFIYSTTGTSYTSNNTVNLTDGPTTDNAIRGLYIYLYSGTGVGQWRIITDYVGSTKVATVSPAWTTTPYNTTCYIYNTCNLTSNGTTLTRRAVCDGVAFLDDPENHTNSNAIFYWYNGRFMSAANTLLSTHNERMASIHVRQIYGSFPDNVIRTVIDLGDPQYTPAGTRVHIHGYNLSAQSAGGVQFTAGGTSRLVYLNAAGSYYNTNFATEGNSYTATCVHNATHGDYRWLLSFYAI